MEIKERMDLAEFCHVNNIKVMGIINSNPFYWDSEYMNIRIYGDEQRIPVLCGSDDRISTICFLHPETLTKRRTNNIMKYATELRLELAVIEKNALNRIDSNNLIVVSDNI